MDLSLLNRICWTICVVCIVAGTALSLSMIWGSYQNESLWKAWTSIGVLFIASAATLIVSKVVASSGDGAPASRL